MYAPYVPPYPDDSDPENPTELECYQRPSENVKVTFKYKLADSDVIPNK